MTTARPGQVELVPFVRSTQLAAVTVAMLVLAVPTAVAQGAADASTIYRLKPDSSFQQPCLCPVLEQAPIQGTFVLVPTGFDGVFPKGTFLWQ